MKRLGAIFGLVAAVVLSALVSFAPQARAQSASFLYPAPDGCATDIKQPFSNELCWDWTTNIVNYYNGTLSAWVPVAGCAGQATLASGTVTLTSTSSACLANVATTSACIATEIGSTVEGLSCTPTAGQIVIKSASGSDAAKVSWSIPHF